MLFILSILIRLLFTRTNRQKAAASTPTNHLYNPCRPGVEQAPPQHPSDVQPPVWAPDSSTSAQDRLDGADKRPTNIGFNTSRWVASRSTFARLRGLGNGYVAIRSSPKAAQPARAVTTPAMPHCSCAVRTRDRSHPSLLSRRLLPRCVEVGRIDL